MPKTESASRPTLDCHTCQGRCCSYFALQIDRPRTMEDFDNLRWYLAHEHVAIFVEKNDWYLQINNRCRYLTDTFACAIYDRRPQICRDYGWDASGETECHGTEKPCDHDHFFASMEELEAYLTKRGKRWTSQPRRPKLSAS